jgi:uroporphyrinogen-III decarboxylase
MNLSKRERVIRTLELNDNIDKLPVHYLGFELTSISYQTFLKTKEYKDYYTFIENDFSKVKYCWAGDITELRYWNVDCHSMDPWGPKKYREKTKRAPPEYPDCMISALNGCIWKLVKQVDTGLAYLWYVDGYFRNPEIVHSYWDKYGRPSEQVNDKLNYTSQIWDGYVNKLEKYVYPMAFLPVAIHESLFEGMTMSRVAYYMRKNPQFIHEVLNEYTQLNIEVIKRFYEAGVDIVFYSDDLGFKGRSIMSLENFRKFILPYYKKLYTACKKRGMFIVQHSCGYIDKNLPDMVDAGLNCIQALEPAAGVDLANLKQILGERLSFMGGIDSSRALNFGTAEDIIQEVKRCVKAAGYNGGYFVGPSHNILNASWENIKVLRDAIEKFRQYPINLN